MFLLISGMATTNSTRREPTLLTPKVLVEGGPKSRGRPPKLLNHNLLLLRIDSALRRLGGYGNHSLSRGQGRGKVMKLPVRIDHRNFASIDHDPRADLRFARHLDHMTMLNERVQLQVDGFGLFALGNNGEAVLFALH